MDSQVCVCTYCTYIHTRAHCTLMTNERGNEMQLVSWDTWIAVSIYLLSLCVSDWAIRYIHYRRRVSPAAHLWSGMSHVLYYMFMIHINVLIIFKKRKILLTPNGISKWLYCNMNIVMKSVTSISHVFASLPVSRDLRPSGRFQSLDLLMMDKPSASQITHTGWGMGISIFSNDLPAFASQHWPQLFLSLTFIEWLARGFRG